MPIEGSALPKLSLDTVPEATFYIPATGPATRPRRALKHDNTFAVLDSRNAFATAHMEVRRTN